MVMKDDDGKFNTSLLDYMRQGSIEVLQSLLRNDYPDLVDQQGRTLLHYAAELNNVSMTRHFINNNHDLEIVDNLGQSPLMLAVEKGSYNSAKLLVEAGANIYLRRDQTANILSYEAKFISKYPTSNEYHEFVKVILRQLKKDCCSDEQLLLTRLRDFGCSLIQAVSIGDANMTRLMLENGYPASECEPETDETALHRAVYLADVKNVKILLRFGASVDARDKIGHPPLLYLYLRREDSGTEVEIMKILIEHGALSSKAPFGHGWNTPVQYIFHSGGLRSLTALKQYDVDFNSYEALDGLIKNENDDVLEVLRGTSFNKDGLWNDQFCDEGLTPLISTAVSYGRLKKVEFLLEHGADPKEIDYNDFQKTPLVHALESYSDTQENVVAIVRLLLQYGANAQNVFIHQNDKGYTAFDYVNISAEVLKTVIAHLAMIESCGETITDLIRQKIDSEDIYKQHFKVCKKQIEEMKETTINGSVTLYKLLTESHLKITRYARDPEFTAKFEEAMRDTRYLVPHYSTLLHKRVEKATHQARLREEAVIVMNKIFSCRFRNHTEIFGEILDYLTCDDLENICDLKSSILSA